METLYNFFKNLGALRLLSLGLVSVGALIFFAYIMVSSNTSEMGLLFSQLDAADGGRILDKLKSMQIPVEVKGDGTQIFVPSSEIPKLRMELAQEGIPSGGVVGYEIFDRTDVLGTTSLLADLNHLRALEGELSRSIRTIQGVQSARVHLVIPKKELFSKEKLETSGSIMVKMRGVSVLSANQVQAIQYLVSSAVPGLTLDKVSIIDDKGKVLARGDDASKKGDSVTLQQTIRIELENKLSRTIESLLDRTLGLGKSRAEVNIEMDFDQETYTSVVYDPDGQIARSTTSNEEGVDANENQNVDTVSIQNALPTQNSNPSQSLSKNESSNMQETTNFEISNTTKTHVKEAGTIKRLSIAVMVDGAYIKGDDDKVVYTIRSDEELEKLKTLVKTAVGFKEDRGDAISLVNLQFSLPEIENIEQVAESKNLLASLNINKLLELGLSALIVLIGLWSVVKPILNAVLSSANNVKYIPPSNSLELSSDNSNQELSNVQDGKIASSHHKNQIDLGHIEEMVKDSAVKKVSEIVDHHTDEAVSIIRGWLYAK